MRHALFIAIIMLSGCTVSQRRDLMDEVKGYVAEEVQKKFKEIEDQKLKDLDEQLSKFKTVDSATGKEVVKIWKDFDADNDGSLDTGELGKVSLYIATESAKDFVSGDKSPDDLKDIGKTAAAIIAALIAAHLGKQGVSRITKKKDPPKPVA